MVSGIVGVRGEGVGIRVRGGGRGEGYRGEGMRVRGDRGWG